MKTDLMTDLILNYPQKRTISKYAFNLYFFVDNQVEMRPNNVKENFKSHFLKESRKNVKNLSKL